MIPIPSKNLNSPTLGEGMLNYIQKGFPVAPRWSLLVALFFYVLFGFITFSVVANAPWATSFNDWVISVVLSCRTDALTPFVQAFTTIGDTLPMIIYLIVVLVILGARHMWDDFIYVLGFVAVGVLLIFALEIICQVPRPQGLNLIELPHTNSFPSAHSGISMIFALFFGMLLIRLFREKHLPEKGAIALIVLLVILAIAIALSRLYLCVHWGTDVLGAWCFALAWSIPAFAWFVKQYPQERFEHDPDPYGVNAILERRRKEAEAQQAQKSER